MPTARAAEMLLLESGSGERRGVLRQTRQNLATFCFDLSEKSGSISIVLTLDTSEESKR